MPHGYTGRKWIRAFGENLNFQLPLIANYFDNKERNELINNKMYNIGVADQIRASRIIHGNDLIQRATRTDFFNYLPEDILVKVDRASMLNSLEIRAPFLDYRIIEFAFREVPSSLKTTSENKKILLKKMCTKLLPLNFDQNRKQGFSIPLNNWLKKKEWMDFFADNLLSKDQILFNHTFIESILHNLKGKSMNKYTAEPLFGLLMFELWRKKYNISI
jgi:asparagine synthase (glutamine-hydrolysing)